MSKYTKINSPFLTKDVGNMKKIEELLVIKGLYEPIDITEDDVSELSHCISSLEDPEKITVDCYCTKCGVNRIFKATPVFEPGFTSRFILNTAVNEGDFEKSTFKHYINKRYPLTFICTYDKSHLLFFDLITTNDKMIKIGQYPSEADLYVPQIKKYKSVLDVNLYNEFKRALLLFSNGIGIGSFVYLRRVIEKIVLRQFEEVVNELETSPQDFIKLKFDKKIEMLQDYLPQSLVKNKNMYGIVSKGIHELTEEECLNYFIFIKNGIEFILDDIEQKTND